MTRLKRCFIAAAATITGLLIGAPQNVYECSFSAGESAGWRLPSCARFTVIDTVPVLEVTVPPTGAAGQNVATRSIDLKPWRGKTLVLSFELKAEGVTKPPQPWNGIKVMFHYKTRTAEVWRNPRGLYGTFDWRTEMTAVEVPADAETGELMIGLQDSAGTLLVRRIRIQAYSGEDRFPPLPLPEGFQAEYTSRVTATPVLRGVMGPNSYQPEDLEELARWGANLIRWQIKRNWGAVNTERDLAEYLDWFHGKLNELDLVLEHARKLGIKVVIDLHTPPGGRKADNNMAMFYEPVYAEAFLKMWEEMATRYKDKPAVWAYDLVNEPNQTLPASSDYLHLQYEAAKRIRAIDPETPIIVESNDWAAPGAFRYLSPLPLPNIIYQAHMYLPHAYTHQSVEKAEPRLPYPGRINGREWNKETLRSELEPVREFQRKYGARIYLGEFSAARWAPGVAHYLEDCIELFEEYGWDWSYHSFREWHGWSVEHSTDQNNLERANSDTDRKILLLKYFGRNNH